MPQIFRRSATWCAWKALTVLFIGGFIFLMRHREQTPIEGRA